MCPFCFVISFLHSVCYSLFAFLFIFDFLFAIKNTFASRPIGTGILTGFTGEVRRL